MTQPPVIGLSLSITVAPLTAAILAGVDQTEALARRSTTRSHAWRA
jgi:hypothetical protein